MYALILAGGTGTRLWPLSRTQFPKQFLKLTSPGQSLFQETVSRINRFVPEEKIIIISQEDQRENVSLELERSGLGNCVVLTEPVARNTAAAVGLAAWYLTQTKGDSEIMAVFPSDHLISPEDKFAALLSLGKITATKFGLVTCGVRPDYPETGYGYICCGQELEKGVFQVERFVEKPDMAMAEEYVDDGRYLWNSGMFMFDIRVLMEEYRKFLPELAAALDAIDYPELTCLSEVYPGLDNISIDHGLLEKTDKVVVLPTDIIWSDVGSWETFYRLADKDNAGNYYRGRVYGVDTHNCLVWAESRLVGVAGLENIIVVETDDALLVCTREKSQEVKTIVENLQAKRAPESVSPTTIHRPWGSYAVLRDDETYKLKRLLVNPGKRLSLQSHCHRNEHWVVVNGKARVTIGDNERQLKTGQHVFIPANVRHRLENCGEDQLEVVEVQQGSYLGEDDIERYSDDYGRVAENNVLSTFERWIHSPEIDAAMKKELLKLRGNQEAIRDCFGHKLAFGTGGLRGVFGPGLNRMNRYIVRSLAQGLANCLTKKPRATDLLQIPIAYDTRRFSRDFAEEAALVFAANGIKAILFSDPTPTPLLSFTIREMGCAAGLVITASHNPPEYNGCKVYGADGCQAVSPFVDEVCTAMEQVDPLKGVKTVTRSYAYSKGLLLQAPAWIEERYFEKIHSLSVYQPKEKLKVVFTPLHGTGARFIPKILQEQGYVDLSVVEKQMTFDSAFPTVKVPNPEDTNSFKLAVELAGEKGADLVLATDPDADRIGCGVKTKNNKYAFLSGNQIGALLLNYLLYFRKQNNTLPENGVMLKTIVTGNLGKHIATAYGLETMETLTGFKYIGEKIEELERTGSKSFIFGYEESLGFLVAPFVRDKDAVQAALLIAEMTAYHKEQGQNLLQVLEMLHQRFGYFSEELISLELHTQQEIEALFGNLKQWRLNLGNVKLMEKRDYMKGLSWKFSDGDFKIKKLHLPRSQVLYYKYKDGSWFCVRPSGTEPKIKLYFGTVGNTAKEAQDKLETLKHNVLAQAKNIGVS